MPAGLSLGIIPNTHKNACANLVRGLPIVRRRIRAYDARPTIRRCISRDQSSELEALIDSVIDSGDLTITEAVVWKVSEAYLKARVPVAHPDHRDWRMELHKNPRLPRFVFSLLYAGKPARRFCSHSWHRNPLDCTDWGNVKPGERVFGYHKHRWSDAAGDECVYIPDDMNNAVSIEEAFYDFCNECGVTFNGLWADPPPGSVGFEVIA